MRYLLVLLILSRALSAQTIRPAQVRGTASCYGSFRRSDESSTFRHYAQRQFSQYSCECRDVYGSDIGAKINASIAALPNKCGTATCPGFINAILPSGRRSICIVG